MKIIHYTDDAGKVFDTGAARKVTGRVVIGQSDGAKNFCMRVFELGPDGHTPRHAHGWEHEIFVHSGKGSVWREGEWVDVETGSVVYVPAGEEHQIRNAGESPLIFVCLIPSGPPEL